MEAAKYIISLARNTDQRPSLNTVVSAPKITIRQKIGAIIDVLRGRERTKFESLVDDKHSRLDMVVTFLAVLELVKRHFVRAYQEHLFGEIELEKTEIWEARQEFDLEFGE